MSIVIAGLLSVLIFPAIPATTACILDPAVPSPGHHQYMVCDLPSNEVTLSSSSSFSGYAFALPQPQPGPTPTIWRTTDAGLSWESIALPMPCPENLPVQVGQMEGDLFLVGSTVYVAMDSVSDPLIRIWKSTSPSGTSFACAATTGNSHILPTGGPQVAPDRTFAVSTAGLSEISAGLGIPVGVQLGRITWASLQMGDGVTGWYVTDPHVHVAIPGPIPLNAAAYLKTTKPMAQGYSSGTQLVPLSGGALYSPYDVAWTTDGVVWYRPDDSANFPPFASLPVRALAAPVPLPFPIGTYADGYAMWDASSDGFLFAVRQHNTTGGWTVDYKWYNGAWHDGLTIALSAEPKWSAPEAANHVAAVRSYGSQLAILTREGTTDILIRIDAAAGPIPTWNKDVIGVSETSARFPNLVFDKDGRAIAFFQAKVAYALTP